MVPRDWCQTALQGGHYQPFEVLWNLLPIADLSVRCRKAADCKRVAKLSATSIVYKHAHYNSQYYHRHVLAQEYVRTAFDRRRLELSSRVSITCDMLFSEVARLLSNEYLLLPLRATHNGKLSYTKDRYEY